MFRRIPPHEIERSVPFCTPQWSMAMVVGACTLRK